MLTLQGSVMHAVLRVGPEDTETWKHTEEDLASIAPPMTRIFNRYNVTRAAAAAGDEILLGAAITRYAARNYTTRRRLLAARQEQARPITGVEAEPGTGPDSDEEWQRVNDPFTVAPPAITPKGPRR